MSTHPKNYVYQNIGVAGSFQFDVISADPQSTSKYDRYITVADRWLSAEGMHEAMNNTLVNNFDPEYNCQHWVLAAMRSLSNSGVVTTEEHNTAWKELQEPFGVYGASPVVSCLRV